MSACSPPQKPVKVDHLPKEYFTALHDNDMDKVMAFYSKDFFKSRPEPQWRERLGGLLQQYGPVKTVSFRSKQADTRYSGKFYIYQFDTVHDQKRVKHILTYVRPVDSDEVKLVGHKINE
ncbi:MAG: hypothetical protein OEZ68_03025 [Gammaproteobacteria bacterium]|nr:hypothetical protein [Gammaproteobacteria bacterium]MDH5799755.1 hypothetical protein [Gammaproteobacteria bacterium]